MHKCSNKSNGGDGNGDNNGDGDGSTNNIND